MADHRDDLKITFDDIKFPDLSDAKEGQEGKGTFSFRIVDVSDNGEVQIEFKDLEFDVGNKADKKMAGMIGSEGHNSKHDDEETDDI